VKLLVLTTSWPSHPDDPAGAFVAESTYYLNQHGFDCRVVPLEIPAPGALARFEGGQWSSLLTPVAQMTLRAHAGNADAVLSHWLLPCAVIGATLGLPQIGVAHGGDYRLLKQFPRLKAWLARQLDGLVAVSPEMVADLQVTPSLLLPMGVESEHLGPPAPLPPISPLRLLFLGRLVPIKGLKLLIDAVSGLDGVTLTVAGDGPDRVLENTAPNNVRFVGPVPLSARKRVFAQHHLLCLPSLPGDASPRVVAEAIAAGRPVLASDLAGLNSRVPPAWRIPQGSVASWRVAIQRLQNEPAKIRPFLSPAEVSWSTLIPRLAAFQRYVFGQRRRAKAGLFRSSMVAF
jgi:glycosyltransferase involved in cell wall biosynthesis